MTTELPRHQSLAAFRAGAAFRYRTPLWTRTAVSAILGRRRVETVELTDLDDGSTRAVACETVVFTADWIPDNELALMGGLAMDPGTRGPAVDAALRTSRPGVFGAGNVLHGAETADVAALSGWHAAQSVVHFLGRGEWPAAPVRVECRAPLEWVSPNTIAPGAGEPPRGRFAVRAREFLTRPRIEIAQDASTLWSGHLLRLVPGRSGRLPHDWTAAVDSEGGPVSVFVRSARG
jgi:hypothetical protein